MLKVEEMQQPTSMRYTKESRETNKGEQKTVSLIRQLNLEIPEAER